MEGLLSDRENLRLLGETTQALFKRSENLVLQPSTNVPTHMSMCLVAASERRDAPLSTTSNSTACECRDELDERISVNVAAVEIGRNDVPSLEAPKVR